MVKRSIFLNGIIITIACFLCLIFYRNMVPSDETLFEDILTDSVGLMAVLIGQYLRISARGYKSEKLLKSSSLIITGPYALVRNPMYLASFLMGLGLVILVLEWVWIPLYFVFFALWYWPQIVNEQKWLEKKYGTAFIEYKKTTPCFFPKVRSIMEFNGQRSIPLKGVWIKKEWNTIVIWVIVAFATEGYGDIKSFGIASFVKELVFLIMVIILFIVLAFFFRSDEEI